MTKWPEYQTYQELHSTEHNLLVVNDCAERFIKLVNERIGTVRSEDNLQSTALTVAELNRLTHDFKEKLESVIKKILNMN